MYEGRNNLYNFYRTFTNTELLIEFKALACKESHNDIEKENWKIIKKVMSERGLMKGYYREPRKKVGKGKDTYIQPYSAGASSKSRPTFEGDNDA